MARTLSDLRPGVFLRTGHRGARGLAPENTLAGFERAVDEVSGAARSLLDSLVTSAPSRDREVEAAKARARAARRFPARQA